MQEKISYNPIISRETSTKSRLPLILLEPLLDQCSRPIRVTIRHFAHLLQILPNARRVGKLELLFRSLIFDGCRSCLFSFYLRCTNFFERFYSVRIKQVGKKRPHNKEQKQQQQDKTGSR